LMEARSRPVGAKAWTMEAGRFMARHHSANTLR
jgi:hypothetical protein